MPPPPPRAPLPRVGISGSYGGLNLGDEAILQSMIASLRRALPVEITVFSRDADHTFDHHDVDRVVPVRRLSRQEAAREIDRLDVFLLGGGGILYDAHAREYLREAALAHELGVPAMLFAAGAGPLKRVEISSLVRDRLAQMDAITVRDRRARKVLEDAGVEGPVVVTADPALLLEPEPMPDDALRCERLDPSECLVGMSVREPGPAAPGLDEDVYHGLLANAADYLVERLGARIVFVPMERKMRDLQHCHAVIARMGRPDRATVLSGEYSPGQLLSLVGCFSFAVGMRLHFLLFAFLQKVPFVALPYAPKVVGFLEELGLPVPSMRWSPGQLIAFIDESWDLRHRTRERLERIVPTMRTRAMQSCAIALSLLEEGGRCMGGDVGLHSLGQSHARFDSPPPSPFDRPSP